MNNQKKHNTKTVIIADDMDSAAESTLIKMGINVDSRPARGEINLNEIIHTANGLLIRSKTTATRELIAQAPHLKAIGRAGIGIDNIDITAATDASIAVINTPLANATSTAEHAIALIFSIARLIPQANISTHAGKWEKNIFKGTEITGKTLGIIGCGNIGTIVADRALGLRMNVIVFDPMLSKKNAQMMGVTKVDLNTLIANSDIITLHTPLLDSTHHILDNKAFNNMKKGVYIVNAARGGLIDENALETALNNGTVAGAALDVYQSEPLRTHPLCNHPRVIMTPHIAASTHEAKVNVALQIANQVGNYLLTRKADHVLNLELNT
ncbi:MAG: hypothetical protein KGV50_03955 [Gammaproteobacteria bacterium]|nr:hypothetical protein [Gammaproteobacteria bacterium]